MDDAIKKAINKRFRKIEKKTGDDLRDRISDKILKDAGVKLKWSSSKQSSGNASIFI